MSDSLNLLLVDDEEDFVQTLAERLDLRGHTVGVVHNGEDALEFLTKTPVDAVVMDMMMPGLSGLETLHRIREDRPDLPVVLLSGNTAEAEAEKARGYGAISLVKPVDLQVLLDALQTLTAR